MPTFLDKPTWYGDDGSVVEPAYITSGSASTLAGKVLTLDNEGCIGGRWLNQGAEGAIYAPDRGGTAGQILRSSGPNSMPVWVTPIISMVNNSANAGQEIYAPLTGGTSGQILTSGGSGAPVWKTFSDYVSNNKIPASNITITSSLGTTNLQTFLTNLMASFRTSSNRVTGASSSFQINGTCTAETFNAATVS